MRRLRSSVAVVVMVGAVSACSAGSDVTIGEVRNQTDSTTDTTGGTDTTDGQTATTGGPRPTLVPPPPPSSSTTEPTTPPTTEQPTTTASTTPPPNTQPILIEDAVVGVWSVWPSGIDAVGPTRLRAFVPGTDDAPPRDGESIPPTPGVPHGYTLANGGSYTGKVFAYEFGDAGAAARWVAQWSDYAGRGPIDRHGGEVHLEVNALPDDGSGWTGLVLDRVEKVSDTSTLWTRTGHLAKAVGGRAYRVEIFWLGLATDAVPDVNGPMRELAAAQDQYLVDAEISDARPGSGPGDTAARVGLVDTLLPWGTIMFQPEIDPPRRWDEYTTASLNAMPAEASADVPDVYAERFVNGDTDGPIYVLALEFSSPDLANGAIARWNAAEASFGPFAFADVGVPGNVAVESFTADPIAAIPGGMIYGIDFQSEGDPLTIGGGWFARGNRAYAAVVSYEDGRQRNADVALGLLQAQFDRLGALGL